MPVSYGLRMLADFRRYRRYLDDNFSYTERLRFAGLQQLLVLQLLVLPLGLAGALLNYLFDLSYDEAWYLFTLRGVFIHGLIVVDVQANYAAATSPLCFELTNAAIDTSAAATPVVAEATLTLPDTKPGLSAVAAERAEVLPDVVLPGAATALAAALAPNLRPWRDKLLHLMTDERPWVRARIGSDRAGPAPAYQLRAAL